MIVFLCLQLTLSFTAKYFMNGITLQKEKSYFYLVFFIFFFLYLFRNCYAYYTQKYLFSLQLKLQTLLDVYLYHSILSDHRESRHQSQPSFFTEKREELYVWITSLFQCIQFLFFDFLLAFFLFSCLCLIQMQTSIFLFPFFLFTVCYYLWMAKKLQRMEKICRQEMNTNHTFFLESMENCSFISTAHLESNFMHKYQKKLFCFNESMYHYFHKHKRMELVYQLIFTTFHLYLFLYFSLMTSTGKMTMGNFILFITVWQKWRVLRKKNRSSRSWLNYIAGRKKGILNYVQVAKLYWIMLTHDWTVVLSAKTRQPARSVRSIAISRPCGIRCVK